MVLFKRTLSLFIVLLLSLTTANAEIMQGGKTVPSFKQDAASIRHTYETQLYTLSAFKAGHYGLRMYRQTMDPKYSAAVWSDMARVASRLNQFSSEVHTPEQIDIYSQKRLSSYVDDTDIRSTLRYQATKNMPEYFYLGVDLLGSMARANEYGLKHRNDKQLREIIRRYDFKKYATDEAMIKAWAAQLANQVYWLRQLGEQDVVDEFVEAFKLAYPDNKDAALSKQQYGNKIYGLTHILLADSQYYQYPLKESDHQWIYDYLRNNIDTILKRTKEDIISEVGITFLLAGLEDDPVVYKTQKHIQNAINREKNMVPSTSNSTDLTEGEHRNVLAIMLLNWQTPHAAPTIQNEPKVFKSKPYGLVTK
ncbi:DUF3541 domain-containing protein [Aliivibrio sp. S4TY2]|uniref:DUF3541 domain-containing protein n=1 Tax=unclassified Aliivibrio TaxID=2645654 RepID=UPI00237976E1|nr:MULTISPECIES: DUF3541 domain-containing protein [unclassified Aliivibrio]MDD9154924.1 DUF3541 domain-containing protein [Aliivibrio sp. S4TY2]MDD9158713.1 DUF3541 domain-containing protein [Aliivibrio sp. S4TY1]MDD9162927.1 DUF3541 domain-containing protein [Aliivibrio sp. S4MY2]MDD9166712.1 DUF3541 domain-containing protein [Aliivibrio sp. S4MY4]MDD9184004.1 DUF3541 domain-containing protein [Aliivibrio sp. S4MY3]